MGEAEVNTNYSILHGASTAIDAFKKCLGPQLPPELLLHLKNVEFSTAGDGSLTYFPCPFKEMDVMAALKAVEASAIAAIADLRFGATKRKIEVNLEKTAAFLFSTYVATIDGLDKGSPNVKSKLKDTDLLAAQSILYRRLSANLYKTKEPGKYYHIHGSLEASKTLNMIGLESYRPDLKDYRECINTIEEHVKKFTVAELEEMNSRERQAGVPALKWDEFRRSAHGKHLLSVPPIEINSLESSSPPCPFTPIIGDNTLPQPLAGIRVLELCRIIAGPAIGRTLAEYGAQVIKVTSPNLSDVPFFQVDGNTGKHTCDIDLKTPAGRAVFDELLASADVILNGYRPAALEKLGYGPQAILEKTKGRGRGIIYVSEDCFGAGGEWAGRPGWQQIADCVTGVAWEQGVFMGLNEPVVPPFPMSDYGTGCLGAIAVLLGLFQRATRGGSWVASTSLCQYDVFLLQQGLYPESVQAAMRSAHDPEFFALRHADSVDEVGKRALKTMRKTFPQLFDQAIMQRAWSKAFGAEICWVRSAVAVEGVRVGFERASRPNGSDEPTWEGWEVERDVVDG